MKNIVAFTVRNTKLFLRDKATVFFSILSPLIIILLYFLFIGKIYINSIAEKTELITAKGAGFIVYLQMMAGVLILNSMSLALGMFTGAAKDFESQKINSFLTAPIKKRELLISYFTGGVLVSFILNLFTWIISVLLIGAVTGFWVSAATFFMGCVILIVASLVSSCIMMLLTVSAKSSTALGVINGVAGTFLGFICGIYMPYSYLGNGMKGVGSFFPFTHLTVWFKQTVLGDAFSQLSIPGEVRDILMRDTFSADGIGFAGLDVPLWAILIVSGLIATACLTIAGLLLGKRVKRK